MAMEVLWLDADDEATEAESSGDQRVIEPSEAIAAANSATNDTLIHFVLGGPLAYLIADKLYRLMRERKNGNGRIVSHRTFADDPVEYWNQMRATVTEPLSGVLDKQTEILEKQVEGNNAIMLKLVALDERTRYIRSEDRPQYNGPERRGER